MILSVYNHSSYAIGLVHINNELYNQMITKWFTFVGSDTSYTNWRNFYYDGIRLSRGDVTLPIFMAYSMFSKWVYISVVSGLLTNSQSWFVVYTNFTSVSAAFSRNMIKFITCRNQVIYGLLNSVSFRHLSIKLIQQYPVIQHNQPQVWLYSSKIDNSDNILINGPQPSDYMADSLTD